MDPLAEVLTEKCQQMRNEMVAFDLLGRDAKLLRDFARSSAFMRSGP
jgi:hypothetical protein